MQHRINAIECGHQIFLDTEVCSKSVNRVRPRRLWRRRANNSPYLMTALQQAIYHSAAEKTSCSSDKYLHEFLVAASRSTRCATASISSRGMGCSSCSSIVRYVLEII